jgi:hypothetical protein
MLEHSEAIEVAWLSLALFAAPGSGATAQAEAGSQSLASPDGKMN